MALKEDFEGAGNWLFRWRSFLPLGVIALFFLSMKDFQYIGNNAQWDRWWELFCLGVSFFGLGIRVLTIGYTPKGTSGRNTKQQIADTLNTSGIYATTRNPLYLGNYFMGLGIALFAHVWWLVAIYTLIFWLYYERIIFAEEAFLRKKFGAQYMEWAEKTPVFIPKISQYTKPTMSFSIRNVLRREYSGFFAVVVCMFLMETLGDVVLYHQLHLEKEWIYGLAASFAIWFSLRALKKKTHLLDVAGR